MALKTLTQLKSIFKEPQLLHRWQIEIPTYPSAAQPANPDLMFFVTSSSMPTPEHTPAEVLLGGFKFNYFGSENRAGEIEWTFFENTDQDVTNYFLKDYPNARQEAVSNSQISLKSRDTSELIAPIVNMKMYNPAQDKNTGTIQLVNAMFQPSSLGGELGQDPTPQQPAITVSFDSFIIL